MFDYKSGDYDARINKFFVVLAIVIALFLGVALVVSALIKVGPVFT